MTRGADGKVYFIRCKATGLIKIGLSENPWSRLTKVQADNPGELEMLAIEDGGRKHEDALHRRFAEDHQRGEWHRPSAALLGYLESVPRPLNPTRRQSMTLEGTALNDRALAKATGSAFSYCAQLRNGTRAIPLAFALKVHGITGDRIGPLMGAADDEIAVLTKFINAPPFLSDVCRPSTRARRANDSPSQEKAA